MTKIRIKEEPKKELGSKEEALHLFHKNARTMISIQVRYYINQITAKN